MAMLVHLAPESAVARIRRSGISRLRRANGAFPGGVFAVPVTPATAPALLRHYRTAHEGINVRMALATALDALEIPYKRNSV